MAEQTFKGLLKLNSKPYTVAQSENPVLRVGEPLAVTITGDNETVTMLKIGDGEKAFNDLPWLSGLASDVYDWALQPNKPKYNIGEIDTIFSDGELEEPFILEVDTNINSDHYMTGLRFEAAGTIGLFSFNPESIKQDYFVIQKSSIVMSDNLLSSLLSSIQSKLNMDSNNISAEAENQIMISDSSLKYKSVSLIGNDYSTIRPRGIRIVSNVDEAAGTPEGCFSAVIGG